MPQTHWFETAEGSKAEQQEIFESQWKIVQLIRKLKPDFVFSEGNIFHLQSQDRKIFTDGLNSSDHPLVPRGLFGFLANLIKSFPPKN